MSRGYGRWQRALLAALEEHEVVPVLHLVRHEVEEATRADLVAARRAARRLAEEGACRAVYVWGENDAGQETILLAVTRSDDVVTAKPIRTPAWHG